jgi:uncharacterized membrane protein
MKLHWVATLQAMFVVFLWGKSGLCKIGLHDIPPPITIAGLRYFPAFHCLLVVLLFKGSIRETQTLTPRSLIQLIAPGIFFDADKQGAIFAVTLLDESITGKELIGFIITGIGALIVQLKQLSASTALQSKAAKLEVLQDIRPVRVNTTTSKTVERWDDIVESA